MSLKIPNFVSIYFVIILFGDIVGSITAVQMLTIEDSCNFYLRTVNKENYFMRTKLIPSLAIWITLSCLRSLLLPRLAQM